MTWVRTLHAAGFVFNFGGLAPEDLKALDAEVLANRAMKVRGYWPYITHGTISRKTVWLSLLGLCPITPDEMERIAPRVKKPFSRHNL